MTARNLRKNSGFTLIEILIVVIILGILAAIVIPQFTNASNDARNSSLASQLQTLRSQVELFKLQHNEALPKLQTDWTQMTGKTLVDGTVNAAGTFGPYLQTIPTNPLTNGSTVADGTAYAAGADFIYDYTGGTGKILGVTATTGGVIAPY